MDELERKARELESRTPWSLEVCRRMVAWDPADDLRQLKEALELRKVPTPWNPPTAKRRRR